MTLPLHRHSLPDGIQANASMSARRLAVRPVLGVLHLLPVLGADSGSLFGGLHLGSILRGLNSVPSLRTFISTLLTVTNTSGTLIVDSAGAGPRTLRLANVDNQAFLCERRRRQEQQRRERQQALAGASSAH